MLPQSYCLHRDSELRREQEENMKKTLLLTALGICCMVAATSRTKAAEKVSGKYHYEIINSTQKTAALTKVEQPGTQVILPSSIDGYTIVQLGTMKENNYHFASSQP